MQRTCLLFGLFIASGIKIAAAAAIYVHVKLSGIYTLLAGRTWHWYQRVLYIVGLCATLAALGDQWPEMMLVQTSVIFVIACLVFRACRKRCHFQSRVRWFLGEQIFRMWIRPLVLHGCCAFWFSTGFVLFGRNAEWWIHFCRVASLLSLLSRSIFGRNR